MVLGDIKFISEPVSNAEPTLSVVSVVCCRDVVGVGISSNRKPRIREREADAC